MNKQPQRLFRRPRVWSLPEGEWRAVPTKTFHGADAFLLASDRERILLSPRGRAHYQASGRGDFFIEDALMQRFEIVSSTEYISVYSALSPEGKINLLPQKNGYKIVHVFSQLRGGFSFVWKADDTQTKKCFYLSRVSMHDLQNTQGDDCLSPGNRSEIIQADNPLDVRVRVLNDHLISWMSKTEGGVLPRYSLYMPASADGSALFQRTRFLSYEPVPEGTRQIATWIQGRVRSLLQTPDGDVWYYHESRERGGESLRQKVVSDARCVRSASYDDKTWISWQGQRCVFWGELLEDGSIETLQFQEQDHVVDCEIIFDDHDRPHLLLLQEGDGMTLRSISLEDGSDKELWHDDRSGWSMHISRCRKELGRGAMLLHRKEAVTFLPVNQSLPVDNGDSLEENVKPQQPTRRGPGRTWANMHDPSWGRSQFEKERWILQNKNSGGMM